MLSHADVTQTGWPQKIAAFAPRPISRSLFLLFPILPLWLSREPDCHIYPIYGALTLLSGHTELRQVKEVFALMPAKRRLTVRLSDPCPVLMALYRLQVEKCISCSNPQSCSAALFTLYLSLWIFHPSLFNYIHLPFPVTVKITTFRNL